MDQSTFEGYKTTWNLRFKVADEESRFVQHYVEHYYRFALASLVLAVMLLVGDFLVDYLAQPEVHANWLRLKICLPALLFGLAYSLTASGKAQWQVFMSVMFVLVSLTLFGILIQIDQDGGNGLKTWVGVLNFTFLEFFCFVVLGVQFWYALIAGSVVLVAFEFALIVGLSWSPHQVAYWSYHIVTLFILTAGIGWWREHLLRKEYLIKVSLESARNQLAKRSETLEEEVNKRTHELVIAKNAAEAANRAKGVFLATMSHELRTPMNGLLGMIELALSAPLDTHTRDHLLLAQSSGGNLLAVLTDILDYSNANEQKIRLNNQSFSSESLLTSIAEEYAAPVQTAGVSFGIHKNSNLPETIMADYKWLKLVVCNLLDNAVKFTSNGQIALNSYLEADQGREYLCFSVTDTGIGISAENIDKIFNPFYQVDSTISRKFGGAGLGLSIANELAQQMDGTLTVQSEVGVGSTFVLRIPRIQVVAQSSTQTPDQALPVASGHPQESPHAVCSILVVDDNAINRRLAQVLLEKAGHQVSFATNGQEAVAANLSETHLILMDLEMPVMGGVEATRILRASGCSIPIVAITAHATDDYARQCEEAGMNDFAAKPINAKKMADLVAKHCASLPQSRPALQLPQHK